MGIGAALERVEQCTADELAADSLSADSLSAETALEEAYAEASSGIPEPVLERVVFGGESAADDAVSEDHARSRVEEASPYALMFRLLDEASPDTRDAPGSARFRALSDTLDLLRAADRLASWVAARQALLTAEVFHKVHASEQSGAGRDRDGARPDTSFMLAAQEIAPLLRVPGRTAHRMLGEALKLTEELSATWEALDAGRISPAQGQVIVEESGSIPAEALAGFEASVLESAGGLTRPKLARKCRLLREELHPETISARKIRAEKDRNVCVQPQQDGMAWLGAFLPAEQAHGIFNRVDAAARSLQGPDEPRTLSQLRADVLADILTHTCTGNPKQGTGFRGVGATVFVTVPVMTLLGRSRSDWQQPVGSDEAAAGKDSAEAAAGKVSAEAATASNCDEAASDCDETVASDLAACENGLLEGYGPIDPETARNLAAHAPSFTRILVHPETGAVVSVGRDRYRPPKHLQEWVRITHPTCVHPGCNRSSWSCEIDHVTPWASGRKTALSNLAPRCKLHHMLKTEGIWPAGQDQRGNQHVTSLGGKTYPTLSEPPPPF